ncbi:hypothetical protein GCM10010442_71040 [Kitasatospora kifunensis]
MVGTGAGIKGRAESDLLIFPEQEVDEQPSRPLGAPRRAPVPHRGTGAPENAPGTSVPNRYPWVVGAAR